MERREIGGRIAGEMAIHDDEAILLGQIYSKSLALLIAQEGDGRLSWSIDESKFTSIPRYFLKTIDTGVKTASISSTVFEWFPDAEAFQEAPQTMWDVSNPKVHKAPVAGLYRLTYRVWVGNNTATDTYVSMRYFLNGATSNERWLSPPKLMTAGPYPSASAEVYLEGTEMLRLNANDEIQIGLYTSSGSGLSVDYQGACSLIMEKPL